MIADFFREIFFHMLLWICGLQFWLHCRNVYDKKPTFFRSTSKTDKKTPKKIFSLNGSFRHVKHSSNNPTEKILNKKPKVLRSVSEKDWEGEIYSGKFFSLKCSSRRAKRSFDSPVDILSRKNQNNFAQALKSPKKRFPKKPLLNLFQWTFRIFRMHFGQTWRSFFRQKASFYCLKDQKW